MSDEHKWLRLIGIRTKGRLNPPRLQNVFISLRLGKANQVTDNILSWSQIFQSKAENDKRIAILGDPGAGKTTLMDYLALSFSEEGIHPIAQQLGNPAPIFVRLREVSSEKSLMDLIANPGLMRATPKGYFERLLRNGKCVVLLDGLDEVLNQEQHDQVVREMKQLTHDFPTNWFIITCRIAGWQDQLPNFRRYEVRSLDDDEVRNFITAWYQEVYRSNTLDEKGEKASAQEQRDAEKKALLNAHQQANALWISLRKNSGLLKVARTPLILSLITLVHFVRQTELPRGRAQLYQRCLDILLEEWDLEDKRLQIENRPSLGDKLIALKQIAFHFASNEILEMDTGGLETIISPLMPNFNVKVSEKDFIQHIYERSGVLVETRIGCYGFAHRALQDYLTASHISENELDDLLLRYTGEEPWHEVIRITAGLVRPSKRAEQLLNSLLLQDVGDAYSLALAGWSLGEDVQVSAKTRKTIRERLLKALKETDQGEEFARLHSALVSADGQVAQRWIREAITGRDPALRERVFGLLPDLPPQDFQPITPVLVSLLESKDEATDVRVQAARALGQIRGEPDRTVWRALDDARKDGGVLSQAATWAWCMLGWYEELGLVKVTAGDFLMGSDSGRSNEKPPHELYLPTFFIGKAPVSVAEFRTFVEETEYQVGRKDSLKGRTNHPVRYVTWDESRAYAEWKNMTLPSEAEWEKAARGTDGRIYPWGNEWQVDFANTEEYWKGRGGGLGVKILRAREGTTAIGSFSPQGDSPYGCVDMSGNVWEWTRTIWNEENFKYPYLSDDGRENMEKIAPRVLRGGSFLNCEVDARCACRHWVNPNHRHNDLGFRVVVSPVLPS